MGDGPYRQGNHAPINVWHTGREHVCTASSPEWATRVVQALNAHTTESPPDSDLRTRVALVVHDVECGCPDRDLPIHDDALRGRWFATADKVMAAIAPRLQFEQATKQQYAEERDEARSEVDRLGLDIQGYQSHDGYEKGHAHGSAVAAKFREERDEALRKLALADAALEPTQHAHADLIEARVELNALKAEAIVLPGDAPDQLDRVLSEPESWNDDRNLAPLINLIESWRGQPDTEATEQAPTEPRKWSVGDDEPDGVTAVITPGGAVFNRSEDRRWRSESVMHGYAFTWSDLVNAYSFVTEVIEDGAPAEDTP